MFDKINFDDYTAFAFFAGFLVYNDELMTNESEIDTS